MTDTPTLDEKIAAVRRAYSDCTERGETSGQPENRQYWATQATALRAVLADLEAQKAGSWQPIETLPEGEHILLWFPNGERGVGGMETGTVFRNYDDGSLDSGAWTHGGPNSGSDWEFCEPPTLWMPLPEPPK